MLSVMEEPHLMISGFQYHVAEQWQNRFTGKIAMAVTHRSHRQNFSLAISSQFLSTCSDTYIQGVYSQRKSIVSLGQIFTWEDAFLVNNTSIYTHGVTDVKVLSV